MGSERDDPLGAGERTSDETVRERHQAEAPGAAPGVFDSTLMPALSREEPAPADFGLGDDFVVHGELARGGMGVILDVEDRRLGRGLAMKVMLYPKSEAQLRRFVQEARVQGRLEHPSICPVHEYGEDRYGRPFFTMKRIRGRSLSALLESISLGVAEDVERYTLPRLLEIFVKVCDAIAFAHSRGVIHRDLKPSNIMVGEFGEVLVMDWGLAKIPGTPTSIAPGDGERPAAAPAGDGPLTVAGMAMGTPEYMPPEQARGDEGIDHRADVYALGGILYAMLTLEPPVTAPTTKEILAKVQLNQIVRPELRSPKRAIPPELGDVAMHALAGSPSQRYASVTELATDVLQFLEGGTPKVARPTRARRIERWAAKNRAPLLTAAVLFAVLVAFTAIGGALLARANTRAREVLLAGHVTFAKSAITAGEFRRAREELELAERVAAELGRDRFAIDVARAPLFDMFALPEVELDLENDATAIAFASPERAVVAFDGLVAGVDPGPAKVEWTELLPGRGVEVVASRSRAVVLVAGSPSRVVILAPADGRRRAEWTGPPDDPIERVATAGEVVAFATATGAIFAARGDEEPALVEPAAGAVLALAAADGLLAWVRADGTSHRLELRPGAAPLRARLSDEVIRVAAVEPEAGLVAFAGVEGALRVVPLDGPRGRDRPIAIAASISAVALSTGPRLFVRVDGEVQSVDLQSGRPLRLFDLGGERALFAVSAGGRLAMVERSRLGIFSTDRGEVVTPVVRLGASERATMRIGGDRVARVCTPRRLSTVDLEARRLVRSDALRGDAEPPCALSERGMLALPSGAGVELFAAGELRRPTARMPELSPADRELGGRYVAVDVAEPSWFLLGAAFRDHGVASGFALTSSRAESRWSWSEAAILSAASFSPSASWVAVAGRAGPTLGGAKAGVPADFAHLWILDREDGRAGLELVGPRGRPSLLGWTPDERGVVAAGRDGSTFFIDRAARRVAFERAGGGPPIEALATSNRLAALGLATGDVVVLDLADGLELARLSLGSKAVTALAFAGETELFALDRAGALARVDLGKGEKLARLRR